MKINIEKDEVSQALRQIIGKANDLRPAFNNVGRNLKTRVQLSFKHSKSPTGQPWPLLKTRKGKALRDTSRLMGSITYKAGRMHVEIGTNTMYAKTHHFGATIKAKNAPYLVFKTDNGWVSKKQVTIPARPFLPEGTLPNSWADDILDALNKHLQS